MPYKDKEQQREYQKIWVQRRRAMYLGGSLCEWCGSDNSINIHHTDPSTKVSHSIWSWRAGRITEELAKCIFLCEECHRKHHEEQWRSHGIKRYEKGCRCEVCTSTKAVHNKRYRDKHLSV